MIERVEMDIDRLRSVIGYSARSGLIRRQVDVRGGHRREGPVIVKKHDVAGFVNQHGYVKVKIEGRAFSAHRLGWAYTFGEWPAGEIDHKNGIRSDNRMDNLRLTERLGNCQNAGLRRDNSTGFKGVTFRASTGRYLAQIAKGRRIHIGVFDSAIDAALAYDEAARLHFGAFACLNFPRENERSAR